MSPLLCLKAAPCPAAQSRPYDSPTYDEDSHLGLPEDSDLVEAAEVTEAEEPVEAAAPPPLVAEGRGQAPANYYGNVLLGRQFF